MISRRCSQLKCALLVLVALPRMAWGLDGAEWPTFQGDERRSGVSPDTALLVPLQAAWSFATGGAIRVQPVARDGRVYFGSTDHKFYALDVVTGRRLWSFIAGGEILSEAAADEAGGVYFGCDDGCVYALEAASGALRWKAPVCRVPPTETTALAQNSDGDPRLNPPWLPDAPVAMEGQSMPTHAVLRAPLLAAGGRLFAGSGREGAWGYLQAFDARDGRRLWQRAAHSDANYRAYRAAESSPVLFGGTLYWAHYVFEALDPDTGAPVAGWPTLRATGKSSMESSGGMLPAEETYFVKGGAQPAVSRAGLAYVPGAVTRNNAALVPIELKSHTLLNMKSTFGRRTQPRPVLVVNGETAYATCLDSVPGRPVLCALDLRTGKELFSFQASAGAPLTRALCWANGLLLGAGEDGRLYAIQTSAQGRGKPGELVWSGDVKAPIAASASLAVAYGRCFIGCEDGKLYCFEGGTVDRDKR